MITIQCSFDLQLKRSPKLLLKTATLHAIFPIIIFLPNALNLSLYILQKANLLGAHGQPDLTPYIVDGVAGAVIGLSSLSVIGTLPPWIAYAAGRNGLRVSCLLRFYSLTEIEGFNFNDILIGDLCWALSKQLQLLSGLESSRESVSLPCCPCQVQKVKTIQIHF